MPVEDDDTHSKLDTISSTLDNICKILGGSSRCGSSGGGGGGLGGLGGLVGGLGGSSSTGGGGVGNLIGGIVGCIADQLGSGTSGSSQSNVLDQTSSLVSKEYSCDTIAYSLVKTLLHSLTKSIVKWIQTGSWDNGPLFITDYKSYLKNTVDQATGVFMKEFLSPEIYNTICSPFRAQLRLALGTYQQNTYAQQMKCTLSTVIGNANNFANNIREGDWNTWITITSNPQNNPYGALTISLDELRLRQAAAANQAQTESIYNQGFLAQKKCTMHQTNEWTGEQTCIRYETVSPGRWIADQIMQASGSDWKELELADELKESISAIINSLISSLFTNKNTGLLGR